MRPELQASATRDPGAAVRASRRRRRRGRCPLDRGDQPRPARVIESGGFREASPPLAVFDPGAPRARAAHLAAGGVAVQDRPRSQTARAHPGARCRTEAGRRGVARQRAGAGKRARAGSDPGRWQHGPGGAPVGGGGWLAIGAGRHQRGTEGAGRSGARGDRDGAGRGVGQSSPRRRVARNRNRYDKPAIRLG